MSIQAGVNQIISISSLLATQTEAYKTKSKERSTDKEIKKIDERLKVAGDRGPETKEQIQSAANLEKEKADLLYEKYKIKPTVKAHLAAETQAAKAEEARRSVPSGVAVDTEHPEAGEYSIGELEDLAKYQEELAQNSRQPENEELSPWETVTASKSDQAREASDNSLKEVQDSRRITRARQGRINTAANRRARRKEQTKLEIQRKEMKKEGQRNG